MQKSIKKTWIGLLVLLIIFVTVSIVLSSNKPKEYPPFLSASPSPSGIKGFYTYLEEEVNSARRWNHAPSLLKEEENQLLLMVEPALITNQAVMKDYLEFVEAGNTILIFKRNLEGMFDISTDYGMIDSETVILENDAGTEFHASMFSQVRILPEANDQVLLQDDLGVIAIKRQIGSGHLIAVNSPDWLTNQHILEENNLDIVLGLLEEESWTSILIDEFTHQSKGKGISDVYPMWLLVAGLQLILFTLLWLLYKGKRFGPTRIPREDYVRFSDERITALASWYQKGKAYRESLNNQAEYLRLVLGEKWGISYQKEWKDLKELLTPKINVMNDEELSIFLYDIESVLQKQQITKQEYLLWSGRIDRLRKEVEEG
ncbi:DUF4350 domain-containing protein [Paucisalibacillus sp. EB02]|uniref:DUF4350 domain-containing protein n=1 Tax=Paucisalibacillus sp. EB02 TaxID=1347087 RepID=UPI0004B57029|nr:DUF4350 domain-containing protein [Paucisalibacillus sp. EB02]